MKTVKKWSFLYVLVVMGVIFFSVTGTWNVMAKPYVQAKDWVMGLRAEGARFPWEEGWQDFFGSGGGFWQMFGGHVSGGDGAVSGTEGGIGVSHGDMTVSGGVTGGGSGGNGTGGSGGSGENGADGSGGSGENGTDGSGGSGENGTGGSGASGEIGTADGPGPATEEPGGPGKPEDVVYASVGDEYFNDAVFIGDSRTVGMFEYGGLEESSTFYASTGLTVFKLFDSPIVTVPGEKQKKTVEEALTERQFAKIYLMIGINEMGTGTVKTFMEKYREALAHLQELQPDAIIYLQAIMKVTTERSRQGDYITNEGIDARNAEIAKLADYRRVYYLDVNPLISDETGGMEPSYTFDGVHLKAQYIPIWKEFLKQRAVVLD